MPLRPRMHNHAYGCTRAPGRRLCSLRACAVRRAAQRARLHRPSKMPGVDIWAPFVIIGGALAVQAAILKCVCRGAARLPARGGNLRRQRLKGAASARAWGGTLGKRRRSAM